MEKLSRSKRRKNKQAIRRNYPGNGAPSVAELNKREAQQSWVTQGDIVHVVFIPECQKTPVNGRGFHRKHKQRNASSHVEFNRYERQTSRIADRIEYGRSQTTTKPRQFRAGFQDITPGKKTAF